MTSPRETMKATFESAQPLHNSEQSLPKGAVLIGVLKSVERELVRRGMLGAESETITPLWFLAETERNIFLWRSGKSLDDQKEFDFWIHVPQLIEKRRAQVEKPHGLNPFINPLWGGAPLDAGLVDRELSYLDEIEELSSVFLPHAEALSHASREVRRDLAPDSAERLTVLLPATRKGGV